jgi:hypothetical protein
METLRRADTPVVIENDNVELRLKEVGEMTVSFISLKKGTDLGPALVGLEGDACQCPHWGYLLEGRLLMRGTDADTTYEAGDAFYWAPGHVPVALEDTRYVDFSPTDEFAHVIRHITGAAAAADSA